MAKNKKTVNIKGIAISFEEIGEDNFISLNDIAKQSEIRTDELIRSWLKNSSTLQFLQTWEEIYNPNFNSVQMDGIRLKATEKTTNISVKNIIKETAAIGIRAKAGRYGGTFAHQDIALNFAYWLSPPFQVYMIKEFQRLKKSEFERLEANRTWHISKITDYVDNARIMLDSMPGQLPENKRIEEEE